MVAVHPRSAEAGHPRRRLISLTMLLALAGCAAVKPAQMTLPEPFATTAPELIQGMGSGRSGEFTLGALRGDFQRAGDKVQLFDTVNFDRATIRYRLFRSDGSQVQAACRGRQATANIGTVMGQPRPYTLECQWSGAVAASMTLGALSAKRGVLAERSGVFSTDAVTLEIHSVHQAQGSPLPLDSPIGYLVTQNGRNVGAIELNGSTPRLWRPAAGSALQEPVTLVALALALLWSPADAGP